MSAALRMFREELPSHAIATVWNCPPEGVTRGASRSRPAPGVPAKSGGLASRPFRFGARSKLGVFTDWGYAL